jgi:arylsulfatase A-like enzyme
MHFPIALEVWNREFDRMRVFLSLRFILSLSFGFSAAFAAEKERPNILFCIMDDASYIHMSAYGCEWMNTPAFDRLAAEGILFQNAYTPNAKCAPSRSSILTGRNSWQLEEAANHVVEFPTKFKTFPEALRENGYQAGKTGKGWGPGTAVTVDGEVRELIAKAYQSENLESRPTNGISGEDYAGNFEVFLEEINGSDPWFFWYGAKEPHRRYEYGTGQTLGGKSIDDIKEVPGFWPDNEIIRNDMLDYGLEIEHADSHLGKMIESLEKRDLMENTLIVMTSDNGMPFPRGKAQEYEYSNHMPLAMMWPAGIRNPGRVVKDMVSFIDLAPTFLDVAGIRFSDSGMSDSPGRSLSDIFSSKKGGQVNPKRDYVVIGKERHDYSRPGNQGFPIRGIVGKDFLYLRNYKIGLWPAGNPELGYLDVDGSPTKTQILELYRSGKDVSYWQLSFGKRTMEEEFFNIANDPECLNNLTNDERLSDLKRQMKTRMEATLKEQEDPRILGNGNVFDNYGFSQEHGWNFYERFMKGEFNPKKTGWVNPSDYEPAPID